MFSKRTRKVIAAFFLVLIVQSVLGPTVSYALTAGPTAPEATSFEPVDTTDLVSLISGDLAYNIPLIEVPGPAGGYPLSLSYHAGIQPNEEASWVGLGFSLNPGAITRNVNGYPDDHKSISNVDRAYWVGGTRETYNAGVSIGIANTPASVNFGLSFSQDTYQGFGIGSQIGLGMKTGVSEALGVNAHVTFTHNPYGGSDVSTGMGIGVGNASAGVMGSTSSGLTTQVGLGMGMVGASISSNSSKLSLTVGGGYAGVYNGKAGAISTKSSGFGGEIPVYPGINVSLGYHFQRYWSDETVTVKTHGSLYAPTAKITSFDNASYDSYTILNSTSNIAEASNPELQLGGSFPNYDNYYVTAQGLSGSIRPYIYKGLIFRQNRKKIDNTYQVKQYSYGDNDYRNEKVEFRFANDFSNKYLYNKGEVVQGDLPLHPVFDESQKTGKNNNDGISENHLAGSKHVEWYSNNQILNSDPSKTPYADGFLDCNITGFNRTGLPGEQIGGYMITNESGVTYHYALPVYTMNEYVYSENIDQPDGKTFNSLRRPTKYAYEWLLTAVTGPDYVDRNNNHIADKGDWGYWVDFKYNKFSSDYSWRNPGEGFHMDLDNNFKNYSSGTKEVYYLTSVRTASHVAIFEKSSRLDAREVTNSITGGFDPKPIYQPSPELAACLQNCQASCFSPDCMDPHDIICTSGCYNAYPYEIQDYTYPESSLRLDRIKLYKTEDADAQRFADEFTLRTIAFQYDYSLAPETPNSFAETMPIEKSGKLTLLSVNFVGKQGIGLIPPITFSYDDSQLVEDHAYVNSVTAANTAVISFSTLDPSSRDKLKEGVIIKCNQSGVIKYAFVSQQSATEVYLSPLGSKPISVGEITNISTTKNPPYGKEKYDVWNMYKVNGFQDEIGKDENAGRMVDQLSAQSVDVWSLRKITNSLGSSTEFEYESDDYSSTALHQNYQFRIESAGSLPNDPHVYLRLATSSKLDKMFKVGDKINILMVLNYEDKCTEFLPRPPYKISLPIAGFDQEENSIKVLDTNLKFLLSTRPTGCNRLGNNFLAGHLGTELPTFKYGGGIRVKNIKLISAGETRMTSYKYKDAVDKSSGSTSYEPFTLGASVKKDVTYQWKSFYDGWHEGERYGDTEYNKILYGSFSSLLNVSREVPAPGVMYKYVTVAESIIHSDGQVRQIPNYSRYEFEVFSPDQISVEVLKPFYVITATNGTYDGIHYSDVGAKDVVIKDYTTRIGSLKKITLYKSPENSKISETVYNYLHDPSESAPSDYSERLAAFNNQGVINETFIDAKFFNESVLRGIVTRRHQYPSIKTGETNINYLTGTKTVTENLSFDFYSGAVAEQLNYDSYGNKFITRSEPAYLHYPQMGSKIYSATNKNMLTQNAATYTFKADASNSKIGLLNASIQTWSDQTPILDVTESQPGIWRKAASFQWSGSLPLSDDGTYPQADFDSKQFDWTGATTNSSWEKTGEITLYDFFSHGLEAKDINGNYAATRMTSDQHLVMANATNASYHEIVSSGSEYYSGNTDSDGGVNRGQGNPLSTYSHTGKFSLLVGAGQKGFNCTLTSDKADLSKKYKASVWVYAPGSSELQEDLDKIELYYTINGQETKVHPVLQKNKSKNWYLLVIDVNPSGANQVYIGVRNNAQRGVYFDDFRVHPINSSLVSYVYDPFSQELTYLLDANNFYTKFDYDGQGRLIRTSKERLNFDYGPGKESYRADQVVSESVYHYGRSN